MCTWSYIPLQEVDTGACPVSTDTNSGLCVPKQTWVDDDSYITRTLADPSRLVDAEIMNSRYRFLKLSFNLRQFPRLCDHSLSIERRSDYEPCFPCFCLLVALVSRWHSYLENMALIQVSIGNVNFTGSRLVHTTADYFVKRFFPRWF